MVIDQKDPRVQELLRQEEEERAKKKAKTSSDKPKKKTAVGDSDKRQRRLFKKTRAGVSLNRTEVKAIKAGRKKLRKEMRQRGLRGRDDFNLTASTLGLYFDKHRGVFLMWLLRHWLGGLVALFSLLLVTVLLFSTVSHARGYFTINITNGMFREGFTLSETEEFDNPTVKLFSIPAENVPCISIAQIPASVNESDGQNNEDYCAYTFYIRNEGSSTVSYEWELVFTAEDRNVSSGMWAMVVEDDVMRIYAKANEETGLQEAIPAFGDDSRGYRFLGVRDLAPESDQFQVIKSNGSATWWRIVPDSFLSDSVIAAGEVVDVEPGGIHKYTVVLWIEGDDPDSTDELISGHAGVAMQFRMQNEKEGTGGSGVRWADLWDDLRFWEE